MADMYVYDAKNPRHTKILYKRFVNQFIDVELVETPAEHLPEEEMDCWNPNCKNKVESEASVTCDDCTSAQESTGAGICETCTCWVDEAYFDQDSTPYCADCYEDVPKESRLWEAKSEREEGETDG